MKRNHGSWKRWLSGLLAAAMLLGVLPFAALAEETLPAQTAAMEEQTAPTTEATEEPTEATEEPTEATEAPTETTEEPAGEVPVPLSDPAAPWDTDGDGVLEILAIGNSFSVDALEYAYRIAADLGIESIALGNLYIGGCSLATHIANANGDKGAYTYYYNDSDSWITTKSYKISTALADRTWDYVTLQQRSPDSGLESTYNEDLTSLIAYVKERSDAKLAWHMTWAYQGDSTHSGFANYGNDQMTMYNGIVTAAQNRILTNGAFSFVIPCGTAVQNSRTSLLGDTTTRDGYHMSYAYGRYLTGLMYIRTLTGLDISGISYAPSGVDDQQKAIAIESVNNAAKTAFAVTQSRYTLQEPGEGYARLELQLTKGAFWHPSVGTDLFFDKSNSNQFFATAKFTREQLPVGSVILLQGGWQYRPDGWVTDELQTGTREETTTRSYTLVTEEWWGDYTLRSFNLSKVGNPSLEAVDMETANEALRIFVPEAKEEAPISFPGKKVSILSHSASTYAGVSNDTGANSTIGNNDVYYTQGRHGVYREDTWWQQAMDALGMELLVNNSWSGSCIFQPRKGAASVGYGDRAVNLHNDHTGEEPEIIWVYLGCNDFAYYQDSFGKAADVNYADLIQENNDGSVSYAAPTTACEAYAIMLHKIRTRYPQAKIYCMTSTARRDPDYSGDSYPDAGQPTAFVAQLHQIAQHYGCPIIDLEQVIPKDAAVFDTLMGDKRAHPNALGMDRITNALLSVMLGTQAEIRHVTSEDATVKEQAVLLGGSYSAKAALREGESAVVIMNGEDITAQAFRDGQITIPKVTGDIEITTALRQTSLNFRWEMQDNAIVSTGEGENTPTRVTGTVTEGLLQNGHYRLDTPVILRHDYNWELQWQFSGNWRGIMLASQTAMGPGALYLSRTKGGQLCFGTMEGTKYHNYGVDLSALDAKKHTFRLSNRVAADGSNMVWLSLDGAEAVPMNRFFLGSADQNRTSDWVSGRDFVLPCLGTEDYPLNDCGFSYLEAREGSHVHSWSGNQCTTCGETAKALPLRYDDHYDITGRTVEILDAENGVVTVEGDYLVAVGIGTALVRIDGTFYEVTVTKAKINLVMVVGQSNSGNHFANATSDVVCPPGTAYHWGHGATEPADYTQPSMGFHAPLLAELYAQSNAAGDPVKNVLIWEEGYTSKNGQSITAWAVEENGGINTSGTDGAAQMLRDCREYYRQHSDCYEIVNRVVFCNHGTTDHAMDPQRYTKLFTAMWERLKAEGMEYLAFLRVRGAHALNTPENVDVYYYGIPSAQLRMVQDRQDMLLVSTLTENWTGPTATSHSIDIRSYITVLDAYGKSETYSDSYGNKATFADGFLTTTMKELYGSNNKVHYGKFGYGLIGADAARNLLLAMQSDTFAMVQADTSGYVKGQTVSAPSTARTIDITGKNEDLVFYPSCDSAPGTLRLQVLAGDRDVTAEVLHTTGDHYGAVDVQRLKCYEDVTVLTEYTTAKGTSGTVTYAITCEEEVGYLIKVSAEEVWIDGEMYAAREDDIGKFVLLDRTDTKLLTVYSYNDAASSNPHSQYPTLMQVWRLTFENGAYVSTYVPEFDNLLQYAGTSIRVTGIKGIRMITGMDKALRSKLLDGSLGYTLVEYGTAVTWAADGIPMLGQGNTMFNFAYRQGVADPIFADTGSTIQYTNVLVGFTDDQLGKDLIMRPYMILEDAAGERITLYGGCVQRSVGYIAAQNRDTFPQGSKADTYIEDIISKVYG